MAAWRHQWQHHCKNHGDSAVTATVAACWQRGGGGGGQRIGSALAAGMAVAAATIAVLPPSAAVAAIKTLAETAMVGAQTTINKQLKSATAMETAMMTVRMMKIETKATAAATEARLQRGGGNGSLARARHWQRWPAWRWRRQLGKSVR